MILSWKQAFNAKWTYKGKSGNSKYDVDAEIEGPERTLVVDVAPMINAISELNGKDLHKHIGRSSLEAVVIHVRDMVKKYLSKDTKIIRIKIIENNKFAVEVYK